MNLIKPERLRPGDTVAAISLSWGGPGAHPHRYEAGKRQLQEELGLRVVETRNALREPDWLEKNPRARAEDLMEAFQDPSIRAVISTIGGDDSVRTLPFLDLDVLRDHPKIFLGYSDSTVTHLACLAAGLVSFYGPAFMAGFAENCGMFPYLRESVRRTLFNAEPIGPILPNPDGWTVELLDWADPANQARRRTLNPSRPWRYLQGRGIASGPLIGGCLDVLEMLKGTAWWPPLERWRGALIFLEASEEAPPPGLVRRWLRNYGSQGILQNAGGILLGRPGGGVPAADFAKYDDVLLEVVAGELGLTQLPIVTQMDFGHTDPFFVLPYGIEATIDCESQSFSIHESAVR